MTSRPDILLYTASTMNGWKPLIYLEEADVAYELCEIDFSKNEQKEAWYVKLNPNGRIPTLVDRGNNSFVVFESGAMLWYLAEKYGKFIPSNNDERSEVLQWLMFQMGGIGPMMGQAMYFVRIAQPQGHKEEFASHRYIAESRRLLEVLDERLKGRSYLVGNNYSIADMAIYPWAATHFWATVSTDGLNNLNDWFRRIEKRPATQRAVELPQPFPEYFGRGDVAAVEADNAAAFKLEE